jgi:protein SCO1/2
MFYGTCPSACPTLTRKIKDIEASVSPEQRAKLRVLMISFDPERDTPAALSALAAKHHLDASRWKLTAASESGAREIAAVLGVEYRRTEEGEFSHSAPITLLDGRGVVVTKVESPADSTDELLRKLRSVE